MKISITELLGNSETFDNLRKALEEVLKEVEGNLRVKFDQIPVHFYGKNVLIKDNIGFSVVFSSNTKLSSIEVYPSDVTQLGQTSVKMTLANGTSKTFTYNSQETADLARDHLALHAPFWATD